MPLLEETVASVPAYSSICVRLIEEWSTPETGEVRLWFRGQKKAAWGLLPGEYRYGEIDADEMRSDFMLRARALLRTQPGSDWEWYFLMQHYGLPTRLLDWTQASLIGLYFALAEDPGRADAAVWILDPWALNEWSIRKAELVITSSDVQPDPVAADYLSPVYQKGRRRARPISIVPPYNSERITVQRGAFTVHGSRKDGLDVQFEKRLAKITIPASEAVEIKRELRSMGISEFTAFPDLDGLCRDIRAAEVEGC